MATQQDKQKAIFKAGIFIISSIFLLIFSILWIRNFSLGPAMKISADFTNPGPLSEGLNVYYRGLAVGRIANVEYSNNFETTIVYIDILKKDVKIPANVYAEVKQEGVTGQKYIDLVAPRKPSPYLLSNNQVIMGKTPFGVNEFGDFLEAQVKSGRLDNIIINLEKTLENARQVTGNAAKITASLQGIINKNQPDIDLLFNKGSKAASNFEQASGSLNDIFGDKQLQQDIKGFTSNSRNITQNVNSLLGDYDFQNDIRETASGANALTKKSQEFFNQFSTTQTENNPKDLIINTIKNTNQAAQRIDCLGSGISDMLSKRFLLIKLIFGKPGKKLEECKCLNGVKPKACNSCE